MLLQGRHDGFTRVWARVSDEVNAAVGVIA